MAKKKAEGQPKADEEMEEVTLEQNREEASSDDNLKTIPSSEIEVTETEAETEEAEEGEPGKKSDNTDAILAGFNMLRDELKNRSEAPISAPPKEEGESEEVFGKRVNEEIFKDDPYGVLKKAIDRQARKIVETEVGPILGSIMEDAFNNAEFRMKNDEKDGPIFRKFEPEVRKLLKTLTPTQQKNPQVLKAVFDKIKSDHVDEIIEMRMEEKEKVKPSAQPQTRKSPVAEGGSSVLPSSGLKRIMIPKSELETLRKKANQLGVPVEVLVERRASGPQRGA
jgi:hypothetical protein